MEITPELIDLLARARRQEANWNTLRQAFDALDNAGIFAAIDEATGCPGNASPDASSQVSASVAERRAETRRKREQERKATAARWQRAVGIEPSAADNIRRAVGLKFE